MKENMKQKLLTEFQHIMSDSLFIIVLQIKIFTYENIFFQKS